MIYAKKNSKFLQESVQKRKTVFEIAHDVAWNSQNKFKNNFEPHETQNFSENADFWKTGNIFSKFFSGSKQKLKVLRK